MTSTAFLNLIILSEKPFDKMESKDGFRLSPQLGRLFVWRAEIRKLYHYSVPLRNRSEKAAHT